MAQKRKEMLWAEECKPLTDEQMENIKSQFHPQANGSNINITPYQIYSTTEQVIGEWLGSPLYQKVINATIPTTIKSGTWTTLATLATNCTITDFNAFVIVSASDIRPLPWTDKFFIRVYENAYTLSIELRTSDDVSTYKGKTVRIIVRYTKS